MFIKKAHTYMIFFKSKNCSEKNSCVTTLLIYLWTISSSTVAHLIIIFSPGGEHVAAFNKQYCTYLQAVLDSIVAF